MATATKKSPLRRRRPEQLRERTIKDVSEEFKPSLHKIEKSKVSIHSAGDGSGEEELGGIFTPTTEQIAKINALSPRKMGVDDVVTFTTNAMNDLFDRDDEAFTKQTVNEFASLPQPFSFVGKSYMADHGRSIKDIRGRIFDVTTKTMSGVHFLRPEIYIPKRPQHEEFIQNIEDGLNWAVSVGVVVDKSNCTICKAPVYTSSWSGWSWCEEGHEKGFYYVPGEEEDDGWGFFIPVDPSTKNAVKAQVNLSDAVDAYELSQVFLGSQLFAQIADKRPAIGKALHKAARKNIPVVGLSQKEAEDIAMSFPREPKEVTAARKSFKVIEEDGVIKWVDDAGLAWLWNSDEDKQVRCLGAVDELEDDDSLKIAHVEAAADDEDEDEDEDENEDEEDDEDEDEDEPDTVPASDPESDDKSVKPPSTVAASASGPKKTLADWKELIKANKQVDEEKATEIATAIDGLSDALETLSDDLLESLGIPEVEDDTNAIVAAAPGASAVLKAAVVAKLPQDVIEVLADADDENALSSVFSEVSKSLRKSNKTIKDLTPKAKIGDQYVADLEKSAIHWYVVSHRDSKNPGVGVSVELAQKLIKQAGGDIDTLKALADDWRHEAEKLYPSPVRRSVVPNDDPNKPESLPKVELKEPVSTSPDPTVARLHG